MDTPVADGFYIDPDTNKVFYVKTVKKTGMTLIPPWVKSKQSDWKKVQQHANVSRK